MEAKEICRVLIRPACMWMEGKKEKKIERKLGRAKELMEKKKLSADEKKERDIIARWLGRHGGAEGNDLLKLWVTEGSVWLRPDPDVLGKAVARGQLDPEFVMKVANAAANGLMKSPIMLGEGNTFWFDEKLNFHEQYYFARVLAAQGHDGAKRLVRFLEKERPRMVEIYERARNAVK